MNQTFLMCHILQVSPLDLDSAFLERMQLEKINKITCAEVGQFLEYLLSSQLILKVLLYKSIQAATLRNGALMIFFFLKCFDIWGCEVLAVKDVKSSFINFSDSNIY